MIGLDVTGKNAGGLMIVLGFVLLCVGCIQRAPSTTNTFLLRSSEADPQSASTQMLHGLVSTLRGEGRLESPYPLIGNLTTEPDPSQANVQQMRCAEVEPDDTQEHPCILLNRAGDFVRVLPITWQSEAFYMYRIYVTPWFTFSKVDPTKDFVAIDVYLIHETGLWEAVDHAIRSSAEDIGARPFRP